MPPARTRGSQRERVCDPTQIGGQRLAPSPVSQLSGQCVEHIPATADGAGSAALGRPGAGRQRGASPTARPGAGLAAQGPRRTPVLVHRGPHRDRPGQSGFRLRRLVLRTGRRCDHADHQVSRLEDRLSHLQRRLFGCRASHRAGRALAHRSRLPAGHGRVGRRPRDRVQGRRDRRAQARPAQLRRPLRQRSVRRPADQRTEQSRTRTCLADPTAVWRTCVPASASSPEPCNGSAEPQQEDDPNAQNLRSQLIELSSQQGFSEEQVRAAVRAKTRLSALDRTPVEELNSLIASAAEKLERSGGRPSTASPILTERSGAVSKADACPGPDPRRLAPPLITGTQERNPT